MSFSPWSQLTMDSKTLYKNSVSTEHIQIFPLLVFLNNTTEHLQSVHTVLGVLNMLQVA